jgi:hypothetical protein
MSEQLTVRVIRTVEEIESIRSAWTCWQKHPLSDVDFSLDLQCQRLGFVRPHNIVISQRGQPDAMLIAKLIHERIADFPIGPWRLFRPHVHMLCALEGGLLGNL